MFRNRLNRRDFLTSTALASLTVVFARSGIATTNSHLKETLVRFARHLYPHSAVADDVFSEVADPLVAGGSTDSPFRQALSAGVVELDSARASEWLSLVPDEQIEVMREKQAEPWFGAIKVAVRNRLYDHPAVWRVIGYDGPSAHLGGYIDRGFNDIDWLPEEE